MLENWDPATSSKEDLDLIKELHSACLGLSPVLYRLAGSSSDPAFCRNYGLNYYYNLLLMYSLKLVSVFDVVNIMLQFMYSFLIYELVIIYICFIFL